MPHRLRVIALLAAASLSAGGCGRAGEDASTPSAAEHNLIDDERIERSLSAAQTYLDSNDVPRAQAILITLINRAPREHRARELYGQSFMLAAMEAQRNGQATLAGEFRHRAYEQYQKVVELQPEVAALQHSAGQMAIMAGDADAALRHFITAGALDSKNPQYPLFAAQLLIQQQRWSEAVEALEKVLALDPSEPLAHASLAMVALERQDFDTALRHMHQARDISPGDLGLRAQEAKIHRRRGHPQRSLELLIGLNAAERGQEMVAFEISAAYAALGQHLDAARAWQHVLQTNPVAPRAWVAAVRVGEALLRAGEREQAYLWLQQAQMAAPHAEEVKALEAALGQ